MHLCTPALRRTPSEFDGPQDVWGCSASPEAVPPTALALVFAVPNATPPPPPIRRPNLADFAELVCRIVGFLNLADLFCRITRFLGLCRLVLPTC